MANEWNFSDEVIGNKIKILSGTRIHIDGIGTDLFHRAADEGLGQIVSAHWNPDGVLVVNDDKGFVHHYLGLSRKFTAHNGDESYFTNSIAYKRALEECQEAREGVSRSSSMDYEEESTRKKGSLLWRFIKWIFKTIFKVLGLSVLFAITTDDSK